MLWVLLQSVDASKFDCYTGTGDKLSCVLGDLTAAAGGEPLFGLFIFGVILFGNYLAGNGGVETPAVLTILLGGVLIPMLPGEYQAIAGTLILLGVAAGFFAVLQRYVLNPSV